MPAPQGHRCPVPPQACTLSHCAGTSPLARRSMMCQGFAMCTPMAPFRSSTSPLPASASSSMTTPTIAQRRTPQGESGAKMSTLRLVSFFVHESLHLCFVSWCIMRSSLSQLSISSFPPYAQHTCLSTPPSPTRALHCPGGGPESHERQCGGLQVHYPCLSGGLHHCCVLGERHNVNQR